MRAFLAIPVQPPALAAFQALRERLVTEVAAVRWTPAESPHITLHFFGAISASDGGRALGVLRPAVAVLPPMTLRLCGLGVFPSMARPRVLWCGVDGEEDALKECARACSAALHVAGFPVERRPYRAHCTLGRPRKLWPANAREPWARLVDEEPTTPAFTAAHAVLYESVPGPAGIRHVPREILPLDTVTAAAVRGPRS
ncbi:MAG: RNA 2',3'-cyclic phosphodiesterase [Candidatus Dormibacteraeota bacterium]|uniref:RNA 2',3'-cyclic phosphodiesterase n=1 Tax=Candidatus Aeolococcus gillhamiae TaxID=3127015 RepID=A0A934K4Q4_9BACT|nr:RNA 2',3'-cyclic phosphodiesterase [Candidatus Dormibacteraeota bacterium]